MFLSKYRDLILLNYWKMRSGYVMIPWLKGCDPGRNAAR